MFNAWNGFNKGSWNKNVDVHDFINNNYTLYEGDDSFLEGATEDTNYLWSEVSKLFKKERENGGTLDVDVNTISGIDAYEPGYICKEKEKIVGLQTDAPLKRAVMPFGGIKMVENACEAYGFELNPEIKDIFTKYRKSHNQGVFDAYTDRSK